MVKRTFLSLALLAVSGTSGAFGALLYDNTTTDTLNTLFYSVGPYTGIGDQIRLAGPGTAKSALLQLFNLGGAGTFDAELRLYDVGTPVGAQIGSTFTLAGVASTGSDIIDLTFTFGSLAVSRNLIFVLSVVNATNGMDLGPNLFQPPTVGSSDNTFLVVQNGGFSQAVSNGENVYFQLSGTVVPEPSTLILLGLGLGSGIWWRRRI